MEGFTMKITMTSKSWVKNEAKNGKTTYTNPLSSENLGVSEHIHKKPCVLFSTWEHMGKYTYVEISKSMLMENFVVYNKEFQFNSKPTGKLLKGFRAGKVCN